MRMTQNPAAAGGNPRARAVPLWRSRGTFAAVAVLNVALCIAGGWWLWQSGWVLRTAEELKIRAITESAELGFTVQEILVVGRRETSRQDLLRAVKLSRGAPILSFDLGSAKERLEALPWIREATIERMLPDTIILNLVERRPLALWQRQGRFSLIDQKGVINIPKEIMNSEAMDEETLMTIALDAGADDLIEFEEEFEVYTPLQSFDLVRQALDENKVA